MRESGGGRVRRSLREYAAVRGGVCRGTGCTPQCTKGGPTARAAIISIGGRIADRTLLINQVAVRESTQTKTAIAYGAPYDSYDSEVRGSLPRKPCVTNGSIIAKLGSTIGKGLGCTAATLLRHETCLDALIGASVRIVLPGN